MVTLAAEFIASGGEQLLVTSHEPCTTHSHSRDIQTLLVMPSILEELNASKRAISTLAQHLSEHNWRVVQFDYRGTGDSAGELHEITLNHWLEDIHTVAHHLESRNTPVNAVLSIRFGSLIHALAAAQPDTAQPNIARQATTSLTHVPHLAWFPTSQANAQKELARQYSMGLVGHIKEARQRFEQALTQNDLTCMGYCFNTQLLNALLTHELDQAPATIELSHNPNSAAHCVPFSPFWLNMEADIPCELITQTTSVLTHQITKETHA